MQQAKAILLGIVIAFSFSEYIGKFLVILIDNWLNLGSQITSDLMDFATVLGVILGIIVYRRYTKSAKKDEQA